MTEERSPERVQSVARLMLAGSLAALVVLYLLWDLLGILSYVLAAIPVFMLTDIDMYRLAFGNPDSWEATEQRRLEAQKNSKGLPKVVLLVIIAFMLLFIYGFAMDIARTGSLWGLLGMVFPMIMIAGCVHVWRGKVRLEKVDRESDS
jgi:amino acid permease